MADPPLADDDDDMEAFSSEAVVNPSIASSATIASDGQLNSNSSSVESAETAISRQQDDYEKAAEEYRLAKETERGKEEELEKERQAEIRRKSREEEEERKRVKRLQREEEQRQLAINQATSTRRRILSMQQNIKNDKLICAGWSKGKTGEEALGRQIHGLWKSSRPSRKQMEERQTLVSDVERVLEKRWPGCGLRLLPFGSTQTGLIEASSDIDLTLIDPMRPYGVGTPQSELRKLPEGAVHAHLADEASIAAYGMERLPDYYSVRSIAAQLRRHGEGEFRQIVPIPRAKVPIVKFVYGRSNLSSDINVNDAFGNVNSDMIRAYIDIDPELIQPYLFVIKKWASRRSINDPAGKSGLCSLNSYTICMIAIQYLQLQGLVPNLQSTELIAALNTQKTYLWQKPPSGMKRSIKTDVKASISDESFHLDPLTGARRFETTFAKISDAKDKDTFLATARQIQPNSFFPQSFSRNQIFEKMGQLLKGFYTWLTEFDFEECGISLRLSTPFRRKERPHNRDHLQYPYIAPFGSDWRRDNTIIVQDPFIIDRNTANITQKMRSIIIDECWRARALLEEEDRESDDTLLSDLLVDFDHEQLIRQHEVVMTSFDKVTQDHIIQKAAEKHTSRQQQFR